MIDQQIADILARARAMQITADEARLFILPTLTGVNPAAAVDALDQIAQMRDETRRAKPRCGKRHIERPQEAGEAGHEWHCLCSPEHKGQCRPYSDAPTGEAIGRLEELSIQLNRARTALALINEMAAPFSEHDFDSAESALYAIHAKSRRALDDQGA